LCTDRSEGQHPGAATDTCPLTAVIFSDAAMDNVNGAVYGVVMGVLATAMVMLGIQYQAFELRTNYHQPLFMGFTTAHDNAINRGATMCIFFGMVDRC
jgi:hypothetical protein